MVYSWALLIQVLSFKFCSSFALFTLHLSLCAFFVASSTAYWHLRYCIMHAAICTMIFLHFALCAALVDKVYWTKCFLSKLSVLCFNVELIFIQSWVFFAEQVLYNMSYNKFLADSPRHIMLGISAALKQSLVWDKKLAKQVCDLHK